MSTEGNNPKEASSDQKPCKKGCHGLFQVFRSQHLLATAKGSVKQDSSSKWDAANAELRGTNVVFHRIKTDDNEGHVEQSDLVAVISVHMYRVDLVQRDDVFRVYFTPKCRKCGVYAYVQPEHCEINSWRNGLARAKATKVIFPGELRVFSRIGEGGYGKVYVVTFKKPGQISNVTSEYSSSADASLGDMRTVEVGDFFAMKVIPKSEVFQSCSAFRHLAAERTILERARGEPYLMELSFAFQTRDYLFLGMPLCAGGDLLSYINRIVPPRIRFPKWHRNCCDTQFHRPRLPEDSVRRIAAQVIVALQTLHSWGILYRDVKAENIFIDADGNIMLGDFGLARVKPQRPEGVAAEDLARRLSMDRMTICGTEVFMAPEVFTGNYSHESDIWSLGVTLFRLLTGRYPFPRRRGLPSRPVQPRNQTGLKFPCFVSRTARSFLRAILKNNPQRRPSLEQLQKHRFFKRLNWKAVREKRLVALPDVPEMLKSRSPFGGAKMAMTGKEWRVLNRKHVIEEDCWDGHEAGARHEYVVPGFEHGAYTGRHKKLPVVGQAGILGGGWVRNWRGVEELPLDVRLFLYS